MIFGSTITTTNVLMNMVYAMLPTSPSTGPQKSLVGGLGQIGSRNYIGLLTHTGLVRQFQVGYLMDLMIYLGEEVPRVDDKGFF